MPPLKWVLKGSAFTVQGYFIYKTSNWALLCPVGSYTSYQVFTGSDFMEQQPKFNDKPKSLNLEPLNLQPVKQKALRVKQSLLFKRKYSPRVFD